MNKKRLTRILGWMIIVVFLLLFIYGLLNYKVLQKDITVAVQTGGLVAMALLCFFMESFPMAFGPEYPVVVAILIGLNPLGIFLVLIISTTISGIFTYGLGYKFGSYFKKFISHERMQRYEKLFKVYGKRAMLITAITPIPHVPAIAGIFKMKPFYFIFVVTGARILRYAVTSIALMRIFGLI
jgi:membrane protein YqaA with SNARE-associated domain